MELVTERLILRDLRPSDFEALCVLESDPEMFRYEPGPYTPEQTRARLETVITWAGDTPRKSYRLGITVKPDDWVVGRISLSAINTDISEWEIGWSVAHQAWGKGYASEAARAVIQYAFTELNAHRVVAFCHAGNAASARVMEKLGMRREGLLRETRWLREQWWDELVYAIVEKDYQR